ncbi:B3 domain-containing protein Os03g0622100-like [Silene latifolia]|uniref:B3 domain-containing protein Os03g0622100-like n=1 Tax=Silene latifolia TaxID=37657 RepID=UPI003D78599F
MARKCENCDIMKKYKYWNELPATEHSFFKVMPDDFDRQLLIPKKFSECFKEKLCGWCILVGPSGKKWRVRVSTAKQNSGRVMFSNDGWPSFVRDHGIQFRDFVTFHYIDNSSFKVSIFDATGCEREESYFAKTGYKSQSNLGNSVEEISSNSRGKKKRSASFDEYDEDDNMSEDYKDESDGESFGSGSGCETNKSVFNQFGRLSSSSLSKSTRAKLSQMYYESNRRTVSEAEMQIAAEQNFRCFRSS